MGSHQVEKTCSYSNLVELRIRVNQLANAAQLA
jgi:hypothetical protein